MIITFLTSNMIIYVIRQNEGNLVFFETLPGDAVVATSCVKVVICFELRWVVKMFFKMLFKC